jgi:hypothetical protein
MGRPELTIRKSGDETTYLQVNAFARGRTDSLAEARALDLRYNYNLQDSLLTLDDHFLLGPDNLWRSQEMNLLLMIPVGQKIYLDESVRFILGFDNDFPRRSLTGRAYIMTETGLQPAGGSSSSVMELSGNPNKKGGFTFILTNLFKPLL